jgi:cytosine/adenosine deaminase-related metal-dependent hydrolase
LVCFLLLIAVSNVEAQDLVITNARIIVGNGQVIEQGSLVVRGGRIVSVARDAASAPGVQTIDARGMTAMPGFIDAHRHIIRRQRGYPANPRSSLWLSWVQPAVWPVRTHHQENHDGITERSRRPGSRRPLSHACRAAARTARRPSADFPKPLLGRCRTCAVASAV